jgi:hypothetical protein
LPSRTQLNSRQRQTATLPVHRARSRPSPPSPLLAAAFPPSPSLSPLTNRDPSPTPIPHPRRAPLSLPLANCADCLNAVVKCRTRERAGSSAAILWRGQAAASRGAPHPSPSLAPTGTLLSRKRGSGTRSAPRTRSSPPRHSDRKAQRVDDRRGTEGRPPTGGRSPAFNAVPELAAARATVAASTLRRSGWRSGTRPRGRQGALRREIRHGRGTTTNGGWGVLGPRSGVLPRRPLPGHRESSCGFVFHPEA